MELNEAIEIYNSLHKNESIKLYCDALHVVVEEMQKRKPKEVYYKSSDKYDYYIRQPYTEIYFSEDGVKFREHYYDAIGKGKVTNGTLYFCDSLCKYTEDKIIESIERHILEDNKETK